MDIKELLQEKKKLEEEVLHKLSEFEKLARQNGFQCSAYSSDNGYGCIYSFHIRMVFYDSELNGTMTYE